MRENQSILYVICPGFHEQKLTNSFVKNISNSLINLDNLLIFPTEQYPPYSGFHLLQYLQEKCQKKSQNLIMIGFSAGVVAAVSAAWQWQQKGGKIKGLIAFDGWGVPLLGNFPVYRVSHDEFTHHSSAILGTGTISFFADPPVEHLDLWRSPHLVQGQIVQTINFNKTIISKTSLMNFLSLIM
ncbi:hypothetical protein [Crocosphaera sp.]|uniref:hypothetical protein n=1 Tax=Crocosphaera sp. TaxID=2729996 RepID=UPI003F20235B